MADDTKRLEYIVNTLAAMAIENTKFNTAQSERVKNILQKLGVIEELLRDRLPKDFVGDINRSFDGVDNKVSSIISKQGAVKLERQKDFDKLDRKISKWLWGAFATMTTIIIQLVILLIKSFSK